MPDITGIDFFNSLSKKPLLIFTTAYSELAVTSFERDAVDYLLKPFSLSRFVKGCNKAYELYYFLRVHRSFVVPLNKIEKLERHQLSIGE